MHRVLIDVDPHEDLQVVQRGILNVSRIVAVGWLAILQKLARYSSEAGTLLFRGWLTILQMLSSIGTCRTSRLSKGSYLPYVHIMRIHRDSMGNDFTDAALFFSSTTPLLGPGQIADESTRSRDENLSPLLGGS